MIRHGPPKCTSNLERDLDHDLDDDVWSSYMPASEYSYLLLRASLSVGTKHISVSILL